MAELLVVPGPLTTELVEVATQGPPGPPGPPGGADGGAALAVSNALSELAPVQATARSNIGAAAAEATTDPVAWYILAKS